MKTRISSVRLVASAASLAAATSLLAAGPASAVRADARAAPHPAYGAARATSSATSRQELQRALDDVVAAGAVGAQAEVVDGHGRWTGVSGHARLGSARPVPSGGTFRAGSITKTFTATVMLQLVAEKRVGLDGPIERYLPGLVPGGQNITVRQLLNHTSGLFGYTEDKNAMPMFGQDFLTSIRFRTFTAQELVSIAVKHPPYFPPGTDSHYSNTNYVLAGLIIEEVTGRSYADEIQRRVVRPLRLGHTYLPGTRSGIPGAHAHGYLRVERNGATQTVDITRMNPSWGGPAGEIISTTADLDRFYSALLGGRLLPPPLLAAMKQTAPSPDPNYGYGLGLRRQRLSCGITVYGHDGGIHGFMTQSAHTTDGRQFTLSATLPDWSGPALMNVSGGVEKAVDTAFCGPRES